MRDMQRHLVYSAVLEDCLALAVNSDGISDGVKQIAKKNLDFAHLGCVQPMDSEYYQGFIANLAKNIREGVDADQVAEQIAFLFGHLCQWGTRQKIGPLAASHEEGIYHDAAVFRVYYTVGMGSDAGMAQEDLDRLGVTQETAIRQMTTVLRALVKRAVMRTHTFKPGYEDIHTWLGRFYNTQAQYDIDVDRYAEAIIAPDQEKLQKHVIDPDFYDAGDSILAVAKALRDGKSVGSGEIAAAVGQEPKSLYGKALKCAYGIIRDFPWGR